MKGVFILELSMNQNRFEMERKSGVQEWKANGALFTTETVYYFLAFIFILAAAFFNWPTFGNFVRAGAERIEMSGMSSAAALYSGFRADGANPSSVQDLLDGVSQADAIDGMTHEGLMSNTFGRWSSGNYTDMWGTAFQFTQDADGANRRIVSAGADRQFGTQDDIVVGY